MFQTAAPDSGPHVCNAGQCMVATLHSAGIVHILMKWQAISGNAAKAIGNIITSKCRKVGALFI